MEKKFRIGIIGTGGIAHSHARSYLQMPDVEIVAGADIVAGKARKFLDEFELNSAKAYDSTEEMLKNEQLDGVSICTYNSTHAICAVAAMEAGIDVLCEKPMSVTIEQAAEMARCQKKTGKILTIGFQPRFDPNMQMVKEIVQSGKLGKVYYIQTGGGRRRGMPGGTFINKEKAGVGALADIGCYGLDMALNSIGYRRPITVSAYASNHFGTNPKYHPQASEFEVDDFCAAFIRFEDGLVLDFRMSWAMHMDTMGDTLFLGTDAGLKVCSPGLGTNWGGAWDGTIGNVYLYQDLCGNQVKTEIPLKENNNQRFYSKCRSFVDAVKGGGESPIPWQEIIYNQAICDGIYRSSQAGHEVEIVIPKI